MNTNVVELAGNNRPFSRTPTYNYLSINMLCYHKIHENLWFYEQKIHPESREIPFPEKRGQTPLEVAEPQPYFSGSAKQVMMM